MRIGLPAETRPGERRAGLTPAEVSALAADGHEVLVQGGAGVAAGFTDADYRAAGASLVGVGAAWDAPLVVKVKELQEPEYARPHPGQAIFSFHHLPHHPARTRALVESGTTAIAFEMVRDAQGGFPLLAPMSRIAGAMAIDVAIHHLGRVPANVLVLGAGHAGNAAVQAAHASGARVKQLRRATATPETVERAALAADLIVGAVFVAGAPTPRLISRELVTAMKEGSMIVDVSIEEGGVAETSRPTTHAEPVYVEQGVLHYCVPNMPAARPREASQTLAAALLPYARAMAARGIASALQDDEGLRAGVVVHAGAATHAAIAREAGVPYTDVSHGWKS
ncbi:MAG TPA: alanine dehydrogenase [Usitatibacter sp.]|nr:alanine dehydrogenase [Usitatibacter sp.]